MATVLNASSAPDGVDQATTAEDVQRNYESMENCDPVRDTVFAEKAGFEPAEYPVDMVRPDLDDLPDAPARGLGGPHSYRGQDAPGVRCGS